MLKFRCAQWEKMAGQVVIYVKQCIVSNKLKRHHL